jgi:hypothetical protein
MHKPFFLKSFAITHYDQSRIITCGECVRLTGTWVETGDFFKVDRRSPLYFAELLLLYISSSPNGMLPSRGHHFLLWEEYNLTLD